MPTWKEQVQQRSVARARSACDLPENLDFLLGCDYQLSLSPPSTLPRNSGAPFTTLPEFSQESQQCFIFIGEFSQKFDLKNVISTNTKDFSWEKWSK
jgi:hypothetical protein